MDGLDYILFDKSTIKSRGRTQGFPACLLLYWNFRKSGAFEVANHWSRVCKTANEIKSFQWNQLKDILFARSMALPANWMLDMQCYSVLHKRSIANCVYQQQFERNR